MSFRPHRRGIHLLMNRKEAAKWYRMAIGQGSSNTFGLAWVWKVSSR